MPILQLSAPHYHALEAVSASLLWNICGPDGCLALARYTSTWLNPDYVPPHDEIMENGTAVHLALLEPEQLAERVTVIDADSFLSKKARELREDAYANGLIPLLADRERGVLRAGRVVLARVRRQKRRDEQLIEPDGEDRRGTNGRAHAAALPSTSSTRFSSQSKPFTSAASGSPWRTTST